MKQILVLGLTFFTLTASFAQKPSSIDKPTRNVGDILFDKSLDDSDFHVCDSSGVFQYYNTDSYFLDNKDSFRRYFFSRFNPVPATTPEQSGYVTVKFIINCDGMTGRFRVLEMDSSSRPFTFDKRISGQLLSLVRAWKNWKPAKYKGRFYDSYQYITFRMRNGSIISISP